MKDKHMAVLGIGTAQALGFLFICQITAPLQHAFKDNRLGVKYQVTLMGVLAPVSAHD
jgi:hypothetical protein